MPERRVARPRARVFYALWPSEKVRASLSHLAGEAQAESGGRAVPAENIHLTLLFVGYVDRSRIAALEDAARSVRIAAFELAIDRVGYWRHNRIVWAGTARCPASLAALESTLRAGLAGVPGEERPYVPHITLVRKAGRKPLAAAVSPCVWRVNEFVLVESIPVDGAVRYQPLARWPLIMAR